MFQIVLLDRRTQEPNEKQREMNNVLDSIETGNWEYIKSVYFRYKYEFKDIVDLDGKNAFFYCFKIPNEELCLQIFSHLYQLKINLYQKDKMETTCLFLAIEEGKINLVHFLVNEMDMNVNDIDRDGKSLMFYAIKSNQIDLIKFLFEKKCNINIEDNKGQNCLFPAIQKGNFEIIKFLIENGISINKVDNNKITPLTIAMKCNDIKIIKYLIEKGAYQYSKKYHKSGIYSKKGRLSEEDNKKLKEKYETEKIMKIQQQRKYLLVHIDEKGEKTKLNADEIKKLKSENPKIEKLLDDKDFLLNEVYLLNKELLFYESWETEALKVINELLKLPESDIFKYPVDPIENNVPNYYEVIKKPMDFSTIKKKIRRRQYTNFKEFCFDVDLIFDNCFKFNGEFNEVGKMGSIVKREFMRLLNKYKMDKFV
jgi:hypothetical protein